MFEVTQKAAEEVRRLKESNPAKANSRLRVQVVGGGCSGMSYKLDFDSNDPAEQDKVFETNGVEIVIDKKSLLFVTGTTLDFSDGLNGKGFEFNNPNATRTCGCGSSFSA